LSVGIFLVNCGFKTINNSYTNQVKIEEIETEGDSRVNIKIKDFLYLKSQRDTNKFVKIFIKSTKEKTIAEKNSKNKITKYKIKILTEVKYEEINNSKEGFFQINESRVFNVVDNNLKNFDTEKREIDTLSKIIAKEIYNILQLNFNDY
jgi:hypothetical protein